MATFDDVERLALSVKIARLDFNHNHILVEVWWLRTEVQLNEILASRTADIFWRLESQLTRQGTMNI
jgi:hypothetical protein